MHHVPVAALNLLITQTDNRMKIWKFCRCHTWNLIISPSRFETIKRTKPISRLLIDKSLMHSHDEFIKSRMKLSACSCVEAQSPWGHLLNCMHAQGHIMIHVSNELGHRCNLSILLSLCRKLRLLNENSKCETLLARDSWVMVWHTHFRANT